MWNSYPIWRGIGWLLAGYFALWAVATIVGWIVRAVLNIPPDENSSHRSIDAFVSDFAANSEAARPVRVIDTGIRGGRENVAFDQALIEAHNAARVAHARNYVRRH